MEAPPATAVGDGVREAGPGSEAVEEGEEVAVAVIEASEHEEPEQLEGAEVAEVEAEAEAELVEEAEAAEEVDAAEEKEPNEDQDAEVEADPIASASAVSCSVASAFFWGCLLTISQIQLLPDSLSNRGKNSVDYCRCRRNAHNAKGMGRMHIGIDVLPESGTRMHQIKEALQSDFGENVYSEHKNFVKEVVEAEMKK